VGATIPYNDFGPRFSFAYVPDLGFLSGGSNRKLSIRGGYGIYYNRAEEEGSLQNLSRMRVYIRWPRRTRRFRVIRAMRRSTPATKTCGSGDPGDREPNGLMAAAEATLSATVFAEKVREASGCSALLVDASA
jgi:hypothetical protein